MVRVFGGEHCFISRGFADFAFSLSSHYLLTFSCEGSCDATELPSKCRARASSTGASASAQSENAWRSIPFDQIQSNSYHLYIYNFLFLHIFKFASVIAHGSCSLSGEPRAGAFYRTAVGCEKNAIVLDVPGTEHGDIRGVGHERSVKTCEPLVNLKMFSWKPRIEEPTTIIPHM